VEGAVVFADVPEAEGAPGADLAEAPLAHVDEGVEADALQVDAEAESGEALVDDVAEPDGALVGAGGSLGDDDGAVEALVGLEEHVTELPAAGIVERQRVLGVDHRLTVRITVDADDV